MLILAIQIANYFCAECKQPLNYLPKDDKLENPCVRLMCINEVCKNYTIKVIIPAQEIEAEVA